MHSYADIKLLLLNKSFHSCLVSVITTAPVTYSALSQPQALSLENMFNETKQLLNTLLKIHAACPQCSQES